jgi:hypothetical protein
LLLLFFERLLVSLATQSYLHIAQAGIALGFSLLVKPIALLLPLFLFVIALFYRGNRRRALLLCLVSYGLVGLYMTRNYVVYNAFSLAPMMSLNMYQCFLSKVIGRLEQRSSYEVAQTTLAFKGNDIFDETGWQDARALFCTTLIKHPGMCLVIWAENVGKTLFGLFGTQFKQLLAGRNDPERPHSFFLLSGSLATRLYIYVTGGCPPTHPWVKWLCVAEVVWSVVRWFLVLVAGVVLLSRRQYWLCMMCVLVIGVFAVMTGMDGCCRYRMTFEPILIILTTYGMGYIYEQWVQNNKVIIMTRTKKQIFFLSLLSCASASWLLHAKEQDYSTTSYAAMAKIISRTTAATLELRADLRECYAERIRDPKELELFLTKLCTRLKITEPADTRFIVCDGALMGGSSGCIFMQIADNIYVVGRVINATNSVLLTISSCAHYNTQEIADFAKKFFGATAMDFKVALRK